MDSVAVEIDGSVMEGVSPASVTGERRLLLFSSANMLTEG